MLNSMVLEVAIGLALLYFLLNTICSAVQEVIAAWMGWRARALERALVRLLGDTVQKSLYNHSLISGMVVPTGVVPPAIAGPARADPAATAAPAEIKPDDVRARSLPSYIQPRTFSQALIDVLTGNEPSTFEALEKAVKDNGNTEVYQAIGALLSGLTSAAGPSVVQDVRADYEKLREARTNIENWYNDAMERLSGRYKRHSQAVLFLIAAALSFLGNVDSLAIADRIASSATVRASLVAAAQQQVQRGPLAGGPAAPTLNTIARDVEQVEAFRIPLGWDLSGKPGGDPVDWVKKVCGLLISTAALTLGAPFWFDVLNRLVNVRTAGSRPDTDPKSRGSV